MSPESFLTGILSSDSAHSFLALAIGFAFAGVLATGYHYFTEQPASFRLVNYGPQAATFAAVPFLIFAAPFIIMRNTIRGARIERRSFVFAMLATILAGLWSLMSGTVVVMALEASRIIP
jgi:hypothetical protein